jgi:hypothetical protein
VLPGSSAANIDQDKEDILKGIWPGSHNVHLLTCFITCHFSGDWTACLLFAHWAEGWSLTASGAPIQLDEWLEEEDHMVNEYGAEAGIRGGGSCRGGPVEGDILNMCNKTCSVPLSHLGSDILDNKATPRSTGFIPSKKGLLRILSIVRQSDIHTMFPPVEQIFTPHELATEKVMEDKMAVKAKEELAVAGWAQAL